MRVGVALDASRAPAQRRARGRACVAASRCRSASRLRLRAQVARRCATARRRSARSLSSSLRATMRSSSSACTAAQPDSLQRLRVAQLARERLLRRQRQRRRPRRDLPVSASASSTLSITRARSAGCEAVRLVHEHLHRQLRALAPPRAPRARSASSACVASSSQTRDVRLLEGAARDLACAARSGALKPGVSRISTRTRNGSGMSELHARGSWRRRRALRAWPAGRPGRRCARGGSWPGAKRMRAMGSGAQRRWCSVAVVGSTPVGATSAPMRALMKVLLPALNSPTMARRTGRDRSAARSRDARRPPRGRASGARVGVEAREQRRPVGRARRRGIHAARDVADDRVGPRQRRAGDGRSGDVVERAGSATRRRTRRASVSERIRRRSRGRAASATASASGSRSSMAASSSGRAAAASPAVDGVPQRRASPRRARPSAPANAARHRASSCSPFASTTDRTRVRVCASLGTYASADDSASLAPGVSSTIARTSGDERAPRRPSIASARPRASAARPSVAGASTRRRAAPCAPTASPRSSRASRPPRRDVRRRCSSAGSLEPQLGARAVALRRVQVRQLEQGVAPRLAARLAPRRARARTRRAPRPAAPPSPAARARGAPTPRRATARAAPAPRASAPAPRRGAPASQASASSARPSGESGARVEDAVRRRPRPHRVAGGERLLPLAQVLVRARRGRPRPCRSSGR